MFNSSAKGSGSHMDCTFINLTQRPDRRAAFETNNAWLHPVRFPALDGQLYTDPSFYRPGPRGNFLSHVMLWHQVAEATTPLLICEDDCVILPCDLDAEIDPSDTFLLLGWNWDSALAISYGLGPVVIRQDQDLLRRVLATGESITLPTDKLLSWPLLAAFGTHAYVLTPKGAQTLLTTLPMSPDPIEIPLLNVMMHNVGIECHLNRFYEQIGARVLFPPRALTPNAK
jgi:hypothetical protein